MLVENNELLRHLQIKSGGVVFSSIEHSLLRSKNRALTDKKSGVLATNINLSNQTL
jgi:hypothetical protein